MTVRLTVHGTAWRAHVAEIARTCPGLVPVVKGNGYGFGRPNLHVVAAALSKLVAVGNVHELHDVPDELTAVVLTPALAAPADEQVVMTVGAIEHVRALTGWSGRVLVKLASSMHRFGAEPSDLEGLVAAIAGAGLDVVGYSIHPPLAGDGAAHRAEVERWLDRLDPALDVWVSHLDPDTYGALLASRPERSFRLRLGTLLWHGDKTALHLEASVLDVHPIAAGQLAGYRATEVPGDGHVVIVGAGSANGVAALDGGLSPFHHANRRLALLEPPYMHTSMVFVPDGEDTPAIGDFVDLQRPLTVTTIDEFVWTD